MNYPALPCALLLLPALCLSAVAAAPPAAPAVQRIFDTDSGKLPFRGRWGTYQIVIEARKDKEQSQRLLLKTSSGSTARELRDYIIYQVDQIELNGKGSPELHVHTSAGGAHGIETHYYYTLDGGLRNLLVLPGDGTRLEGYKDLDRDGLPEILAMAPLNGVSEWSSADTPFKPVIAKLRSDEFHDATRLFPDRALTKMKSYQTDFLKARRAKDEAATMAAAAGYYLNALCVRQETAALDWLASNASRAVYNWLLAQRSIIALEAAPDRARVRARQNAVLTSDSLDYSLKNPI